MNFTKEQLTAKQQMIVVCEGMLQLLEPGELSQVMEDVSRRVRERLSPSSSVTDSQIAEDSGRKEKKTRGREVWVRGVRYSTVSDACRKHGITEASSIGAVRRDINNGVSVEDLFPKLVDVNKISLNTDSNGNVVTESDKRMMGE